MKRAVIVSAVRTPIGSFGGVLSTLSATELGSIAVKGALEAAGITADQVQEVYLGNVVQANLGQSPARQVALGAGLPSSTICTTINKVCASGTKSIMLAAQSIMLGQGDIFIAGGFESMSNIPYYVPKARYGYKYGHGQLVDGLVRDGLEDVYAQKPMGAFADATAKKYEITREQQDEYTIRSYKNAQAATADGSFKNEIVPVSIAQKKGEPKVISQDEEPNNVIFDKIPSLKPVFTQDGTVTAANASTINDGATALVIMSEERAAQLGLKPLAAIVSFADYDHEPEWFTTAPAMSVPKALKNAGLSLSDMDYLEINEAFAVVPMAVTKIMDADPERVNVRGGAVALGHPLGCSGARIVTTMAHLLQDKNARYGAVGICNGGGGSSAMVIERM